MTGTKGRLKVVLEALGISGNELARRLQGHPEWRGAEDEADVRRQVSRWNSGNLPGAHRLIVIAAVLGITVGQLVGSEDLPGSAVALDDVISAAEVEAALEDDRSLRRSR